MKSKNKNRQLFEYTIHIQASPDQIFPLLCPVREYEWIPEWDCTMLYSESGIAELGCVFSTNLDERFGEEVWVISHYVNEKKIGFVRTGKYRSTRYEITLTLTDKSTTLQWMQEITGLNPKGDELVASYSETEFTSMMTSLQDMLNHFLKTGNPLSENL